jgi:hypothetical protein
MNVNELIYGILIYILAIMFHEFGHFIVAKYFNKFIKIQFDIMIPNIVYYTDNDEEETQILIFGIMSGLIILTTYGIFLQEKYKYNGVIFISILMIAYIIGSSHDIYRLIQIIKNN